MKTLGTIFAALIIVCLITAFSFNLNKEENQTTSNFIIITYTPYALGNKAAVSIHYGGNKVEEIQLTKEQVNNKIPNFVVDLLTKYNSQGYDLVSSTGTDQISLFLKKEDK